MKYNKVIQLVVELNRHRDDYSNKCLRLFVTTSLVGRYKGTRVHTLKIIPKKDLHFYDLKSDTRRNPNAS